MSKASFASVVLVMSLAAGVARAHGGPPELKNVLASDDDGPWLVELTEGFALREADGAFSYVCPALFAADVPPASATVGDDVWLVGGMDLFRLSADRSFAAAGQPDLSNARVFSVAAHDGALLALRTLPRDAGSGSEVVRWQAGAADAAEALFTDPAFWSALAVQPPSASAPEVTFWLARIDDAGFELLQLSVSGQALGRARTPWPSAPLSIRLAVAGEQLFVHVYDDLGYTLVHAATRGEPLSEGVALTEAPGPMRGPVVRSGETLLARGQDLLVYRDGALELTESPLGDQALTCLTGTYACTASRLYAIAAVEADGGFEPSSALVDLAQLAAPSVWPADPELEQRCTAQWLVFQADLVRAGIIVPSDGGVSEPELDAGADAGDDAGHTDAASDAGAARDAGVQPDAAPAAQRSSGGCAVTRGEDVNGATLAWLFTLCVFAIYARRR